MMVGFCPDPTPECHHSITVVPLPSHRWIRTNPNAQQIRIGIWNDDEQEILFLCV